MAKKIIGNLKLRIPAGRATAGPPVGSTLGQWGLNMMDFINPFNDATKADMGKDVIVHIQVFEDRTFAWKSLGQPVDDAIRDAVGIKKGSGKPHSEKVGKITRAQLHEEIYEKQLRILAHQACIQHNIQHIDPVDADVLLDELWQSKQLIKKHR